MASSFVGKEFIFAFPAACIITRSILRPFIWRWIKINRIESDLVTDYITNYLCFMALSVQIFILLFVKGRIKHVTILLFLDTVVFLGFLIAAIYKTARKNESRLKQKSRFFLSRFGKKC